MAELSIETQAILDRLKKEGDLLRNSGTNSIKSVKVELSKFENIFGTISSSIQGQVETLREAAGFSRDAAEAQQRQNELLAAAGVTDQERAELEKRRFQTEQLKADQDYKDQEEREQARQKQEKGFFNKLGGFFSAKTFGNILSGIKFAALAGLGIAVGYQFIAGVLEGMGVDVKSFEKGFVDGVNNFIEFVKDVDWKALGETFKTFATPEAAAAALGLSLLPQLISGLGDAALIRMALKSTGPNIPTTVPTPDVSKGTPKGPTPKVPTPEVPKGGKLPIALKSLLSWRTALLSAVGTGLIAYSGEIGEFFKDDASKISKDDLMNTPVNETAGGEDMAIISGAATLGSIFGIKGMLVGAAIGGAYVIGKNLVEAIDDAVNDLGELPNDIESALRSEGIRKKGLSGHAGRIANNAKTVEEAAAQWMDSVNAEVSDLEADLAEAEANIGKGNNRVKMQRKQKIARLKNEIELRQQQIDNVQQLLTQRAEEGIADFDIETPGTQTKAEFEVNQKKRDEAAAAVRDYAEKFLADSASSLGLDFAETFNPLAVRAESMDSGWHAPLIFQIDQSTTVGGSTINARSSTGGSYVLRAEGGTSGVSKTVLPGGLK